MIRSGHVAHVHERRDAYRLLVGKVKERYHLQEYRRRWKDHIKIELQNMK